jgi:cytochrome c oxidase subunit 2
VQLILIGVLAAGVASAVALIPDWLPPARSEQAGRIDFVFWFVTGICIFIFAIVAALSIFAVLKFRAAPDDDSDGPPIHGHTGLEITWTAVPALLVTAIAIVSAIVLAKDDAEGANPLRVEVFLELQVPELRQQEVVRAQAAGRPLHRVAHERAGRHPLLLGA